MFLNISHIPYEKKNYKYNGFKYQKHSNASNLRNEESKQICNRCLYSMKLTIKCLQPTLEKKCPFLIHKGNNEALNLFPFVNRNKILSGK